ncbi:hypothetical protein TL16_g10859 [Triparma laevis f. inornata]|uniref:Vta1/callose synthase N-terminal domain-containing protein n=2 Tax=Triparma laevis TaxID=1534972 RepID=A0A9W7FV35_9STRA|nr:hypothetical protein TL16_g10859 [Triparma laevis f. inornata]GMI18793.1 hypothetical protein TrLO_g13326 [Triparma laevis f. longispina]
MPPLTIPSELKKITAFIRRAEELDNDKTQATSRLIAYYCRQWAVELSLPLLKIATDPASKTTLLSIMSSLEEEKTAVGDAFTKPEAYTVCRDFAQKVLSSSDSSYSKIHSSNPKDYSKAKIAARSYYACGVFFDILAVFENASVEEALIEKDDISSRRKYAKWRASLILGAIKNGEDLPTPVEEEGEEGEEKNDDSEMKTDSEVKDTPLSDFNIPEAPRGVTTSMHRDESKDDSPPPVYEATKPIPGGPKEEVKKTGGWFGGKKDKGGHSKASIGDALELAKFAVKALEEKEVEIARERLQQALECLK